MNYSRSPILTIQGNFFESDDHTLAVTGRLCMQNDTINIPQSSNNFLGLPYNPAQPSLRHPPSRVQFKIITCTAKLSLLFTIFCPNIFAKYFGSIIHVFLDGVL